MTTSDTIKKELYVAVHGQTARFRVVKYIVLFAIGYGVHYKWGWDGVAWALGLGLVFALAHALLLPLHEQRVDGRLRAVQILIQKIGLMIHIKMAGVDTPAISFDEFSRGLSEHAGARRVGGG